MPPFADTLTAMRLRLASCPSDPRTYGDGANNYAGCHHELEAAIDADNHGVFFLNSGIRSREIPDGASHTIYLGEKMIDNGDLGWMSGPRTTVRPRTHLPRQFRRARRPNLPGKNLPPGTSGS